MNQPPHPDPEVPELSEQPSQTGAVRAALGSAFESVDCGVLVVDRRGVVSHANDRASALLRVAPEDLVGRTSFEPGWDVVDLEGQPVPPESYPSVRARDSLERVPGVVLGVAAAGSTDRSWLRITAVPRIDAGGRLEAVILTLVDVTESVLAAQVRDAEDVLRAEVLRTSPSGIIVVDADQRVRLASDEATRLLGLTPDANGRITLRGRLIDDRGKPLPPNQLPHVRVRERGRALLGGRYVWTSSSGRRRILMVNGAPLDGARWPGCVVLSFIDVTQHEAATRALRHSERRLAASLKAADLGRFVLDLRQRTVSADRTWLAGHGFPLAMAEGDFDLWRSRIDRLDTPEQRAAIDAHRAGETPQLELEFWMRTDADRARRLRCIGQIIDRDSGGRPTRISGVLMDITAEYEAREAVERLEAQAAEMARLEGVAAVAGGVAHTFSNLLVGVMGAVQAAREGAADGSPLAEALDLLADASARAGDVTTQLRAVSGGNQFSLGVVRLDDFVAASAGMLETGLAGRATLRIQTDQAMLPVEVDVDQLLLVLMNLVLNAADSTPRGGPAVVVRTRMLEVLPGAALAGLASPGTPLPGTYAMVEVADRGLGMSAAVQGRMFEPFFTTHPDRRGLGLSAVLGVARGHSGFVQVHSDKDTGTTLAIGLPLVDELAEAPTAELVPVAVPAAPRPRRVLVVDDEPTILRLVQRVLERAGFGVETVSDGHAALDRLEEAADAYGALLLDLTMPGLSGRDVLEVVLDRWPDLEVVVMSGYTDDPDIGRLLAADAVRFLAKPFGSRRLGEVVAAAVGGSPDGT